LWCRISWHIFAGLRTLATHTVRGRFLLFKKANGLADLCTHIGGVPHASSRRTLRDAPRIVLYGYRPTCTPCNKLTT
jgi:hypothetical protein